jgi:hypothetical protein
MRKLSPPGLPHPCRGSYYTIDAASLRALSRLCLVSRFFNAVTTPILYSTITLSHERVLRLLATAESNPKLLQCCRSIDWPGTQRMKRPEINLLTMMSGLHRFSTVQRSWRPFKSLRGDNLVELSLPGIPFSEICWPFPCTNLERLVVKSIWNPGDDPNDKTAVHSFSQMPRLAYLIVVEVDVLSFHRSVPTMACEDLAGIIQQIPCSCRVVFGLARFVFDYRGFRRAISSLPDSPKVILLAHPGVVSGSALTERIVDGTLWGMDFEKYLFW